MVKSQKIIALYESGSSVSEISKLLNIRSDVVHRLLLARGLLRSYPEAIQMMASA